MKIIFLYALIISPLFLCAQQNRNWFIKTGKLFDSEAAEFKTGFSILVKDGNIEAVGPDSSITAEQHKQYPLIDLSKYAVLPD